MFHFNSDGRRFNVIVSCW